MINFINMIKKTQFQKIVKMYNFQKMKNFKIVLYKKIYRNNKHLKIKTNKVLAFNKYNMMKFKIKINF